MEGGRFGEVDLDVLGEKELAEIPVNELIGSVREVHDSIEGKRTTEESEDEAGVGVDVLGKRVELERLGPATNFGEVGLKDGDVCILDDGERGRGQMGC